LCLLFLALFSALNFDVIIVLCPYFAGVATQFLYLWASKGAVLPFPCSITYQTWPLLVLGKAVLALYNHLNKQVVEKLRFHTCNIFGIHFWTQLLWSAWLLYVELRLNYCVCDYRTVLSCRPIVQLPSSNDLRRCRQSSARITQPTYQKKRRKVCVVSLKIFLALVLWRNCCGMRNHLMQELRLNSYRCEYQRVQKNTLCPMIWTKH
jgi:hypothetical protein